MENDVPKMDKDEISLTLPVLHVSNYVTAETHNPLTAQDKEVFLKAYFATGNLTTAAKAAGRDRMAFMQHLEKDEFFKLDFLAVKDAMKHSLEEVMYKNGLTSKGYMDRITWLRRNYASEYNPNYQGDKETVEDNAIKKLAAKLNDYEIIPKKNIIDTPEA